MPNQPKTPLMALRIEREVQELIETFAKEREVTKSDVVRKAITDSLAEERLPHHSCRHNAYGMSCEDFDELHARSEGSCEICGAVPRKLYIDHDHSVGLHGIRGLLCPKCDALMRRVDSGERKPDAAATAYVADSWHLRPDRIPRERKHTGLPPKSRGEKFRTPAHVFACSDDIWAAAMAAAERNEETVSDVIRRALEAYVRKHR